MHRRLELQALRADLGTLDGILRGRTEDADPLGFMQLSQRRLALMARLTNLEATVQHKAAVALFFAGGPVLGSRGIEASFAAKTVGLFQDLVSKQFAMEEMGELGRRGPVAMQPNSDLLVTNLVRGSVGLLFEEADVNDTFADTQLKVVVDHVVDAMYFAAATTGEDFEQALERMDPRFLSSLGEFFEVMDEKGAVLRLVEEEREVDFDAEAIRRGRERAGAASIEEGGEQDLVGRIFILPAARRFELHITEADSPLTGVVARDFARHDLESLLASGSAIGERWRVRIKTRTVTRPTRPPKISHTLTGMVERID